jgi:hypothetical protein
LRKVIILESAMVNSAPSGCTKMGINFEKKRTQPRANASKLPI